MGFLTKVSDRLANVMSGAGTSIDRRTAAAYVFNPVTDEQAEASYRVSWLVRKLVDIPAKDMTREWRNWQADAEDIEALEKEEKRLQLKAKCQRALTLSRIYGGAAILIGDGSSNPAQELNVEKIGKEGLRYLRVMPPRMLTLGQQRLDPEDPFCDKPEYFEINAGHAKGRIQIHPSRVVEFIGQKAPEGGSYHQGASWFWGDPLIQAVGDAVKNADMAQSGFAALVDEAKLDVLKMPGLTELAATAEGEVLVTNRLSMTMLGKSTWRALLLDKEDEWEQRQITWAGIPEVMMSFLQIVCGAADIPVTRFLGESPKGLASTGDGEERDYHSKVRADQEELLQPALDRIDEVLIRSALGKRPEEIHYVFAPLSEISEKDGAELDAKTAQTLKTYGDTGLIHEEALAEIARNKMIESGRWPGCEDAFKAVKNALAEGPTAEEEAASLAASAANENEVEELESKGKITRKQANDRRAELQLADRHWLTQPRARGAGSGGGKWVKGGTGAQGEDDEEERRKVRKARVIELTPETKDRMLDANRHKTVEQLVSDAKKNQAALRLIGAEMEKEGLEFHEPLKGSEVKTIESINRKVRDELYSGPHMLSDISRASIVVTSAADSDRAVQLLGERGTVYDKGWKQLDSGYLDRKVYLAHPNGGVSEVQIIPAGVYQAKNEGGGHALYEVARLASTPFEEAQAATAQMKSLYAGAIAGTEFENMQSNKR
jgi:phage-related protein (TIGR01555 family)